MSADANDPSSTAYGGIPAEHHKALEFYACWQAADYDDNIPSSDGDKYFANYQGWLGKIRTAQTLKGGSVLPRVRVGRVNRVRSEESADAVWS